MNTSKSQKHNIPLEIKAEALRDIPSAIPPDAALAFNQNQLALERTEFAKIRTDLAINNSRMSADRTHLSYLRTIVSLLGSGATLYEALPLLGVNRVFSSVLAVLLVLAAIYFIYKDATTYPKMKKQILKMEEIATTLAKDTETRVYRVDPVDIVLEETMDSLND